MQAIEQPAQPNEDKMILRAEGIRRSFGDTEALAGVDIALSPGQLYGLIGPDGAGKTTLIRILAGLMRPQVGGVLLAGHDPLTSQAEIRRNLGYMPQAYSLYGDLSVAENLRFFGRMFDLDPHQFQKRQTRLLSITRLSKFIHRRADALSGGMYKKLALACALLHTPKVLLLDEPTNGVDPLSRRELWELLGEFVDQGMAILISTPYMDEASRCHRVGLIYAGRILSEGEPDQLLAQFPHATYQIEGCNRAQAESVLTKVEGVLGFTPAGSRIRVVVKPAAVMDVQEALGAIGGRLVDTKADFEDLFLSLLADSEANTDGY